MAIGKRLKAVRESLGLTQKEFAEKLEISQGHLSELERGIKKPGSDILLSLKQFFNVSIDWLLTGEGSMFREEKSETSRSSCEESPPEDLYCPVEFYADLPLSAGWGNVTFEEAYPEPVFISRSFLEQYFKTRVSARELLIFPVDGNSMEPTIPNGCYVLVRKFEYEGLLRPKEGSIYALIYNNEFYLKRVCIRDLPNGKMLWKLLSDNPAYPPIVFKTSPDSCADTVKVIGRVIGYIKKI